MTADQIAQQAFGLMFLLGTGLTGWQIVGAWLVRVRQAGEPS